MDIKEAQAKILTVIRDLNQCGEIMLYYKGETVK
jgi:flagellar motor switch protein FliG